MVLSEDEVPDGEVLWRAFKCSYPTFASTSFAPYRHPFPLVVGRPPTLTIQALPRRYTALSALVKVLTCTTMIYIAVTPWFVKNYPLCTPSRTPEQPSRDPGPSYPYMTFIFALDFRFHYLLPLGGLAPTSAVFFRLKENFLQGTRPAVADKLQSRCSSSRNYGSFSNSRSWVFYRVVIFSRLNSLKREYNYRFFNSILFSRWTFKVLHGWYIYNIYRRYNHSRKWVHIVVVLRNITFPYSYAYAIVTARVFWTFRRL